MCSFRKKSVTRVCKHPIMLIEVGLFLKTFLFPICSIVVLCLVFLSSCRVRDRDNIPHNLLQMKKTLEKCFSTSSFIRSDGQDASQNAHSSDFEASKDSGIDLKLFLVPSKGKDGSSRPQYESYTSALWKVRDQVPPLSLFPTPHKHCMNQSKTQRLPITLQVLSMNAPSFSRTVSERDWLKNSAKIWELIKNSPIISDYCRTLQNSGLYRK